MHHHALHSRRVEERHLHRGVGMLHDLLVWRLRLEMLLEMLFTDLSRDFFVYM